MTSYELFSIEELLQTGTSIIVQILQNVEMP